jgi:hypothetical protein
MPEEEIISLKQTYEKIQKELNDRIRLETWNGIKPQIESVIEKYRNQLMAAEEKVRSAGSKAVPEKEAFLAQFGPDKLKNQIEGIRAGSYSEAEADETLKPQLDRLTRDTATLRKNLTTGAALKKGKERLAGQQPRRNARGL